jgi:hypothetical protein
VHQILTTLGRGGGGVEREGVKALFGFDFRLKTLKISTIQRCQIPQPLAIPYFDLHFSNYIFSPVYWKGNAVRVRQQGHAFQCFGCLD